MTLARTGTALAMLLLALTCVGGIAHAQSDRLDQALQSLVRLDAEIPGDARTAEFLGTERSGTGIVIDDSGLILTIGYLILEAMAVTVSDSEGRPVPAELVAYDYDTGFGLVRASAPLNRPTIRFGESRDLASGTAVLVAAEPGRDSAQPGQIVDVRSFTGYWEYLLDQAIYVTPAHPKWQGAALIGPDGALLGVGSLFARDAQRRPRRLPGNMFIPIDALKPILGDLLVDGRSAASDRPWLGVFTSNHGGYVVVTYVAPEGPAAAAGLRRGDVILEVAGERVKTIAGFLKRVWAQGKAGVSVPLTLGREDHVTRVKVSSGDRYQYMKLDKTF